MKKRRKLISKKILGTGLLILSIMFGAYYLISNNEAVGASYRETTTDINLKPAYLMNYKLGDEADVEGSIRAYESTKLRIREVVQKDLEAQKETEVKAKKEKERVEKQAAAEKEVAEAKKKAQAESESANQTVEDSKETPSQGDTSSTQTASTQKQSVTSSTASRQQSTQTQPKAAPKTPPKTQPAPAPTIGANKIGINGMYRNYSNYGQATTAQYQAGIDSGLIVAGISNFNGNDGQTTYFGGHNPGIMNFIANNIYNGAVVTITDANGESFQYKMIDKVDVDEYGEGVLQSIGVSAISAYAYGTGEESILIHFCNTSNNLMSFWYGVKI